MLAWMAPKSAGAWESAFLAAGTGTKRAQDTEHTGQHHQRGRRFRHGRDRYAVGEEHRIDIDACVIGRTCLKALGGHEIVVVGDDEEVVVGVFRIERRNQRQPFPFFRQIIESGDVAVHQSETVQLVVIVDIQERCVQCRNDFRVEHPPAAIVSS